MDNPYLSLPDAAPQGQNPQAAPQTTPSNVPLTQQGGGGNPYSTLPDATVNKEWGGYPALKGGDPASASPSDPRDAAGPGYGQVVQGLISSTIGMNSATSGAFAEATGVVMGHPELEAFGAQLAQSGENWQKDYPALVPTYRDIRTDSVGNFIQDFANWGKFSMGQAVGSMLLPILGGMAGAGVGTAIGGGATAPVGGVGAVAGAPIGAVVGFGAGFAAPAYINNVGDVYLSIKSDPDIQALIAQGKLSKEKAAKVAYIVGLPITALDSVGAEKVLGIGKARDMKRSIIRRIIKGMVTGTLWEGTTEGIQDIMSQVAQSYLGSNPTMKARVESVLDNAFGGAWGGLASGGVSHIPRGKTPGPNTGPTLTDQEANNAYKGLVGERGPGPTAEQVVAEQQQARQQQQPPPGGPPGAAPIVTTPESTTTEATGGPANLGTGQVYNEANPPPQGEVVPGQAPVEPAPQATPGPEFGGLEAYAGFPVNMDIGFGYSIRSGDFQGKKFALVDDQGQVLAASSDIHDVYARAMHFLDIGDEALQGPPPGHTYYSETTDKTYTPQQAEDLARKFLKDRNFPAEGAGPEIINQAIQKGMHLRSGIKPAAPTGRALVPVSAPGPYTLSSRVVDFVDKQRRQQGLLSKPSSQDLFPSKQEVAPQEEVARIRVDVGRTTRILGPKLYGEPSQLPRVAVKELLQNSFDAIKALLEKGTLEQGHIDFSVDEDKRVLRVYDNGTGMTKDTLLKKFLTIAGSHKETTRPSGNLGIAKMLVLFENKGLRVLSLRDGILSRLYTTGEELLAAAEEDSTAVPPKVQYSPPTAAESAMFPEGHGTIIEITVPKNYQSSSSRDLQDIWLPTWDQSFEVLKYSPLFDNIQVTWNGETIRNIGSTFNLRDYTTYTNVDFPWGTVRMYVSRGEVPFNSWGDNVHVLSNGIWQFNQSIKVVEDGVKKHVPYRFYVDVSPSVAADHVGYPFDLNRQRFSPTVQDYFEKIFFYIRKTYEYEQFRNDAVNYGDVYYLDISGSQLVPSDKLNMTLTAPPVNNPAAKIRPGDVVSVEEGRLLINGRETPAMSLDELEDATKQLEPETLVMDQETINPNSIMIHDNTEVRISHIESKTISEMAHERFGTRFDEFVFEIGTAFRILRDGVARSDPEYKGMEKWAIGVSFDPGYRGVNIMVPFSGMFINPAVPEYTDSRRAGVGMVITMLHEIAHFKFRKHNASFVSELQSLLNRLISTEGGGFSGFTQKVVDSIERHRDIFDFVNGAFTGAYDLRARGRSFETDSSLEVRNGGGVGAASQVSSSGQLGPGVSGATGEGTAAANQGAKRSSISLQSKADGNLTVENRENERIARDISPAFQRIPAQPSTKGVKSGVKGAFRNTPGGVPPATQQMGVHADHMNILYNYAYGNDRLADLNPRFTPLLRYNERVREMRLDTAKIHDYALRILKPWRRLGTQTENLAAMIDDYSNMVYRSSKEIARGVMRMPTQQEFLDLVKKHQLSREALQVFLAQKKFFSNYLTLVTQNAMEHARRVISDPVKLANTLDAIRNSSAAMASRPYFPHLRFGSHWVEVRHIPTNKIVHFETFERRGVLSAERQQLRFKEQMRQKFPDRAVYRVTNGVLPEQVQPFIGLPPELLEHIKDQLQLLPAQRDAMEQLMYELSPAASFTHRFIHKNYTPGYSHDFMRAFARYAFHGARYYARAKYGWMLQEEIKAARQFTGNKEGAIANYMAEHFQNTVLDARGDFGLFKGAIFLWVFGYSVVGATINLSQVPMISFPFLASRFGGAGKGDALAMKELVRQITNFKNFYTKGAYDNQTDFEMRAMDYGIKSGRITESFASQLAGIAQGGNLFGVGNNAFERGISDLLDRGAWMFEMTEQFNRRLTYMTALNLASRDPGSLAVKEALNKYNDEFQHLKRSGFSDLEARAVVAAIHSTEQTQFVYSRDTRPKFMRGRLAGTVFVFWTYMVNVLQLLGANKSSVMPRFLFIMLAMGGLMGVPGAENGKDIINWLAKKYFGDDFDLELAMREFIRDLSGGKVDPTVILHGLSSRGFGIPALIDMLGEHPGRGLVQQPQDVAAAYKDYLELYKKRGGKSPMEMEEFRKQHSQNVPVPVFDLSRSLSMGKLLPLELDKLTDPGKDVNEAIASSTQQAAGAIFSVGFNLYKALHDYQRPASDLKRWERAMPRALAGASRAYRAFTQGRERSQGGPAGASTVVNYDVRDTEQMAEIIGMSLGFMPARQSAQWDLIMAQQEVIKKFDLEREILLKQLYEAQQGGISEEIGKVQQAITDYNDNLPDWAIGKSIGGKSALSSLKTQIKGRAYREAGVPVRKSDRGIVQNLQSLFPGSVVDVRRVPQ